MIQWLTIIGGSIAIGCFCAAFIKNLGKALLAALVIPVLTLLLWLLFCEYVLPYQGGGASMWPVALIFGGGVVAFLSVTACGICQAWALHKKRALSLTENEIKKSIDDLD